MRLAALLLSIGLAGCRERANDIKPAPERELQHAPPPEPPPGKVVTSLVGYVGDDVTIVGAIVARPRPRLAYTRPGKRTIFIDVDGSHLEVAAHVASTPDCKGGLALTGKVIVAVGLAKDGTTAGEYAEPQLDVERWRCR